MPPPVPGSLQSWLQFAGLPVSVATATIFIMRMISRLESRLERLEIRIATLESQNRALLKAIPQVIFSMVTGHMLTPEQGGQLIANALESTPIAEILSQIKPTINPLSQADIDRLRDYIERLRHEDFLNPQEAQDFCRLTDIITREYPQNEGSWMLFLVGGILLGLLASQSKR